MRSGPEKCLRPGASLADVSGVRQWRPGNTLIAEQVRSQLWAVCHLAALLRALNPAPCVGISPRAFRALGGDRHPTPHHAGRDRTGMNRAQNVKSGNTMTAASVALAVGAGVDPVEFNG